HRCVRPLMELRSRFILERMGHVNCRSVEADRSLLRLESLPEFGCQYADTSESPLVEIVQVMRGARRARSAIGQRDDYGIAIVGDILDHLARCNPRVGWLFISVRLDTAFGAKLLEAIDKFVA